MGMKLDEIVKLLCGKVIGDISVFIEGLAPIEHAKNGDLTFADSESYLALAEKSQASAVIVREGVQIKGKTVIQVSNPKLAFGMLLTVFYPPRKYTPGIHPSAVVEDGVKIGEGVYIGPNAVLEKGALLGKNVVIGAGAFVGEKCVIGDDSFLHPNVTLYSQVRVGSRVIIHSGSVIGSDGFGYIQQEGKHIKIPQVGLVIIEDDVEIGSNVCIDRGTIGPTTIKKGTKIDNLVQIAHNCIVGEYTILVSQVGLSGSVKVGDHTILLGQTGVTQGVKIGDNVMAGARTAIWKDVPSNQKVLGMTGPYPHRDYKRQVVAIEKLPNMMKEFRELTKRVEKLESSQGRPEKNAPDK